MLTCNLQTAARERTIWWVCLILGPYLALYFINFSSFHCLEKKNYDFSIDFMNILMDLEKKMCFLIELQAKWTNKSCCVGRHLWISILKRLFENRISKWGGVIFKLFNFLQTL
mmetsp:Transcript_17396/g.22581  ORF Transcript_17396/g.22581 Transcript_17396/m.22581 type:complete len:113 (-) Transcript_17396:137-475(-)